MPVSDQENKDVVIRWYKAIKPRSVLDIGAGAGTYAKLIADKAGAHWTALEVWTPYIKRYKLADKYDQVIVADARYLDYSLIKPDMVIAGDVLEHMTKAEAQSVIDRFKEHANSIIICVPLVHLDQSAYMGNWFEEHKDHWTYEDMCSYLGGGLQESVKGETLGYFLWQK